LRNLNLIDRNGAKMIWACRKLWRRPQKGLARLDFQGHAQRADGDAPRDGRCNTGFAIHQIRPARPQAEMDKCP
jgi:hypothetical protein